MGRKILSSRHVIIFFDLSTCHFARRQLVSVIRQLMKQPKKDRSCKKRNQIETENVQFEPIIITQWNLFSWNLQAQKFKQKEKVYACMWHTTTDTTSMVECILLVRLGKQKQYHNKYSYLQYCNDNLFSNIEICMFHVLTLHTSIQHDWFIFGH